MNENSIHIKYPTQFWDNVEVGRSYWRAAYEDVLAKYRKVQPLIVFLRIASVISILLSLLLDVAGFFLLVFGLMAFVSPEDVPIVLFPFIHSIVFGGIYVVVLIFFHVASCVLDKQADKKTEQCGLEKLIDDADKCEVSIWSSTLNGSFYYENRLYNDFEFLKELQEKGVERVSLSLDITQFRSKYVLKIMEDYISGSFNFDNNSKIPSDLVKTADFTFLDRISFIPDAYSVKGEIE